VNSQEELHRLSKEMYHNYGAAGYCIAHFEQFAPRLARFDFLTIMDHQMREEYPHGYVLGFFLATPFLWRDLALESWLSLLLRPRELREWSIMEPSAAYVDVEFLSRYVRVDALQFLLASPLPSLEQKQQAMDYYMSFGLFLVPKAHDAARLDGEIHVAAATLEALGSDLCRRFHFAPVEFTTETAMAHVEQLRQTFGLRSLFDTQP
jgi:hypothetical protein